MTTKTSRRADVLFAGVFFLLAIALAFYTGSRTYHKLEAASWPAAQAEVVSSSAAIRILKGGSFWCLNLRYRYLVDGKEYTSKQISTSRLREAGCDRKESVVAEMVEQLPPGEKIEIRYNPASPDAAVLDVDKLDLLDYFLPVLAVLLCLIGLMVGRPPRMRHRETEAKSQLIT